MRKIDEILEGHRNVKRCQRRRSVREQADGGRETLGDPERVHAHTPDACHVEGEFDRVPREQMLDAGALERECRREVDRVVGQPAQLAVHADHRRRAVDEVQVARAQARRAEDEPLEDGRPLGVDARRRRHVRRRGGRDGRGRYGRGLESARGRGAVRSFPDERHVESVAGARDDLHVERAVGCRDVLLVHPPLGP